VTSNTHHIHVLAGYEPPLENPGSGMCLLSYTLVTAYTVLSFSSSEPAVLKLRSQSGAKYCDQHDCASIPSVRECISETRCSKFTKFRRMRMWPVAVARSSFGVIEIRYVLPVLWRYNNVIVIYGHNLHDDDDMQICRAHPK